MNPEDAQVESDRGDEHMDNVSYGLTAEGRLQVANARLLKMAQHVEVMARQVELLTDICRQQQETLNEHAATIAHLVEAGFLVKQTLDVHTKSIRFLS